MERELRRGTLDMLLLKLLSERDMYGYEITTTLDERSNGAFEVTVGTLYPVLYRLEEAGYVEPYWETGGKSDSRGSPRKYYRLEEAGERQLEALTTEWRSFAEVVSSLLESKPEDER